MAINHHDCPPVVHDRTPPEGDDRGIAADGALGCSDCGRAVFYCQTDSDYHHVDPEASCWLVPAWSE